MVDFPCAIQHGKFATNRVSCAAALMRFLSLFFPPIFSTSFSPIFLMLFLLHFFVFFCSFFILSFFTHESTRHNCLLHVYEESHLSIFRNFMFPLRPKSCKVSFKSNDPNQRHNLRQSSPIIPAVL